MLTRALLSAFSSAVRVTGPLRAMSWNVSIPLRLSFHLRAPGSPGQSILATWLNSSPFLSDNALNCFCWFTVLKAHQSYGSWLSINQPGGLSRGSLATPTRFCWRGSCRRSVSPLLPWHLQDSSPLPRFLKCQGYDRTNLAHENCPILRHLHVFKAPTASQICYTVNRVKSLFTVHILFLNFINIWIDSHIHWYIGKEKSGSAYLFDIHTSEKLVITQIRYA